MGVKTMIEPTFWGDPDFDEIDDLEPLAFYLYLMTNEASNFIGVYRFSKRKAVTDARLMPEQIDSNLALLQTLSEPKICYDDNTKWLWVRGSFARNYKAIKNKSIAKNVMKMIDAIVDSDCPFADEFLAKYKDQISSVKHQCVIILDKGIDKVIYSSTFNSFWLAYPNRKNKAAAFKAWEAKSADDEMDVIMAALEEHKKSRDWKKENGKYIPHPATWLNGERWHDCVSAKAGGSGSVI
jgi:hypothetical protein